MRGIKPVHYRPPPGVRVAVEAITVRGLLDRAGPAEFEPTQRLTFDMVVLVTRGSVVHTVDFTDHRLHPGDLLWVHAGQVHRWGPLDAFDGEVLLFATEALGSELQEALRTSAASTRAHWPATGLADSGVPETLALASGLARRIGPDSSLGDLAARHAVAALLLLLLDSSREDAERPDRTPPEAFTWFRDLIEESYRSERQVSTYAARLGYSTRTLNRLSREWTGLSAKELIDERVVLEAKRFLGHTDEPVAQIAESLGFDDPSNFATYFTRRVGQPPTEWRRATGAATSDPSGPDA